MSTIKDVLRTISWWRLLAWFVSQKVAAETLSNIFPWWLALVLVYGTGLVFMDVIAKDKPPPLLVNGTLPRRIR